MAVLSLSLVVVFVLKDDIMNILIVKNRGGVMEGGGAMRP